VLLHRAFLFLYVARIGSKRLLTSWDPTPGTLCGATQQHHLGLLEAL